MGGAAAGSPLRLRRLAWVTVACPPHHRLALQRAVHVINSPLASVSYHVCQSGTLSATVQAVPRDGSIAHQGLHQGEVGSSAYFIHPQDCGLLGCVVTIRGR